VHTRAALEVHFLSPLMKEFFAPAAINLALVTPKILYRTRYGKTLYHGSKKKVEGKVSSPSTIFLGKVKNFFFWTKTFAVKGKMKKHVYCTL
jgi:hypothetical protein